MQGPRFDPHHHKKTELGMRVLDCNPALRRLKQEYHKVKASMGFKARPCLKIIIIIIILKFTELRCKLS
jgi:hypothetical protein